jgi:phosphoribosylcarboxyaminoimidazole (NCAIR) mutase
MTEPIKIAIMIGSRSDLKQCVEGLKLLKDAVAKGRVKMIQFRRGKDVAINSIHRHRKKTVLNFKKAVKMRADVILAGAGKAAHLPGIIDSVGRHELRDDHTRIIAVAFKGKTKKSNQAALRSIDEVPGNQMIFTVRQHGSKGFTTAVRKAIKGNFPSIKLPDPIPDEYFSFDEAIAIGEA